MKSQTIDVEQSTGRILCCTIFRAGGRKLLAKGHLISEEDTRMLKAEGMNQVWVAELEEAEVGEDDAVKQVACEIGCGSVESRLAPGGRANLFATEPCCLLVDEPLLRRINCMASVVIATSLNFSYARRGQRVATVKSTPFAVAKVELQSLISLIKDEGPMLQARPIREPVIGILYSDPSNGDRARQLFENCLRQRLDHLDARATFVLSSVEEEEGLARNLQHMLHAKPTVILIASTTAPAGPSDAIGRAMVRIGCHIECFLAPVEPGNLLLLGYKDDVPIVSVPGCFHSARPNILDLMLAPMLSRYRISGWEVSGLGHGGLLA